MTQAPEALTTTITTEMCPEPDAPDRVWQANLTQSPEHGSTTADIRTEWGNRLKATTRRGDSDSGNLLDYKHLQSTNPAVGFAVEHTSGKLVESDGRTLQNEAIKIEDRPDYTQSAKSSGHITAFDIRVPGLDIILKSPNGQHTVEATLKGDSQIGIVARAWHGNMTCDMGENEGDHLKTSILAQRTGIAANCFENQGRKTVNIESVVSPTKSNIYTSTSHLNLTEDGDWSASVFLPASTQLPESFAPLDLPLPSEVTVTPDPEQSNRVTIRPKVSRVAEPGRPNSVSVELPLEIGLTPRRHFQLRDTRIDLNSDQPSGGVIMYLKDEEHDLVASAALFAAGGVDLQVADPDYHRVTAFKVDPTGESKFSITQDERRVLGGSISHQSEPQTNA